MMHRRITLTITAAILALLAIGILAFAATTNESANPQKDASMPNPHINETVSKSQPRQAAIAQVGDDVDIETVTAALEEIGVSADRVYFLIGQDGAAALEKTKGFLSIFDDVIDKPLSALRDGHTMVGVFGVDSDNADTVRRCLVAAGCTNPHYFGKWTYS
ncbi:MAG: hypothetical protein ACRBK7_03645 [Acidimicrobiales bacterium]